MYRHKKSDNIYDIVFEEVINATNLSDGQVMVMYRGKKRNSDEIGLFVREKNEFLEKFEEI